ncbi:hypothetical protein CY34DRAFT_494226 [Suillus luteus UH-Slu-Lm8-n1]|uniref:DUF6533 domain-containing protein n=1 Tax=Suillus luteus UH-Slu-Lm8-n1 TaxID=930992 RepID=A0A0D0AVJ6_9AGAM|nr:hypothetical protein CY34DRAFT_494226 [Suillus luteus UH-Slu-Lm8-n1]
MTLVSNDPSWWPQIEFFLRTSYVSVASSTVLIYDWALTFGQELDLVWILHDYHVCLCALWWNTILFRHHAVVSPISPGDRSSNIYGSAQSWISVVENAMLGVIMIARLHAMYQRSRILLILLIVIFVAFTIACIVITAIQTSHFPWVESVLSGTYWCIGISESETVRLVAVTWILGTVWEVIALCLALIVAAKHFRELQRFRQSTGQTMEDYFTVLIKAHVLYFAFFAAVSCLTIGLLSPNIANSTSVGTQIYSDILQFFLPVQMQLRGRHCHNYNRFSGGHARNNWR